jgi:uncharacterized protein (TIGR03437 family)
VVWGPSNPRGLQLQFSQVHALGTGRKLACRLGALALCAAIAVWAATLARYPYLQNVRSDRATVLWTTLEKGLGTVEYSTDRSFSRRATARVREFLPSETGLGFPYYQYEAELTDLSSGTEYLYRVTVDGQIMPIPQGAEARFRTAGPGPFQFLVFGDSGTGSEGQLQVAGLMIEERPALLLHAGDVVMPVGAFSEQQAFYFDPYARLMLRAPIFPCPGNHDYDTKDAAAYLAVHSLPADDVPAADRGRYYSFDWGNVHFVSLDTNRPFAEAVAGEGEMLKWLERDLQKSRAFWRVVYFHHPPYASGPHETEPPLTLVRENIVPILDRYGVNLVFNGHEHSYQRTWPLRNGEVMEADAGTVYITTGGGGSHLYHIPPRYTLAYGESTHHYMHADVEGYRMTLHAIRADGKEIDRVTLAPPPLLSYGAVVNAASFTPTLAPGGLVSIFGRHLASEESRPSSLPLPTGLSGASVTLNGRPVPLVYVSGTQINAQLPYDVQGYATLVVATPNGATGIPVTVSEVAPAIFYTAGVQPAVVHSNGALVSAAAPGETGEWITVYLTGLGRLNGEIAAGQAAPSSPPLTANGPVEVRLGGRTILPSFAGLTPGFAGLYQVNLQIPGDLASGVHELRVVVKGVATESVSLAVRSNPPGQG